MNKEEAKRAEVEELNKLINRGMSFMVERKAYVRQKGIFSFLKKRIKKTEYVQMVIQEPTLAVLNRMSLEQIELELDEEKMQGETWQNESSKLAHDHSLRMSRLVAIAVLGEDYFIPVQHGSNFRYKEDIEKLDELTSLIAHGVKPSKLFQLAMYVSTMSNMGDFTNSIRLMSANRTTMPIRIEENKEG